MGRHRSLANQLGHCVRESFSPGQSKHSEKGQGKGRQHDGRTYSYSSRSAKLDLAKNFGGWMKSTYPDVRRAVDVTPEHANRFLLQRAAEGCTQATLDAYASNLRSIGKEIANTFGRSGLDGGRISTPRAYSAPVRTVAVSRDDRDALERSFGRGSNGGRALAVSRASGLRSEEIAELRREHIAPDGSSVTVIGGKGGRDRVVPVFGERERGELVRMREATAAGERVVPVKAESINRSIRRHMEKLGIAEKYPDTTLHALRKTWAQERYDYYRAEGMSIPETVAHINCDLGHSDDREELLERYVDNIH